MLGAYISRNNVHNWGELLTRAELLTKIEAESRRQSIAQTWQRNVCSATWWGNGNCDAFYSCSERKRNEKTLIVNDEKWQRILKVTRKHFHNPRKHERQDTTGLTLSIGDRPELASSDKWIWVWGCKDHFADMSWEDTWPLTANRNPTAWVKG